MSDFLEVDEQARGTCHGTAWFWVNSVYGKAALDF